MDKQNVVNAQNEISGQPEKKEGNSDTCPWVTPAGVMLSDTRQSRKKGRILFDFAFMKHLEQ